MAVETETTSEIVHLTPTIKRFEFAKPLRGDLAKRAYEEEKVLISTALIFYLEKMIH